MIFPTIWAGKKRNEFFNNRAWLQKEGSRITLRGSPGRQNKDEVFGFVETGGQKINNESYLIKKNLNVLVKCVLNFSLRVLNKNH